MDVSHHFSRRGWVLLLSLVSMLLLLPLIGCTSTKSIDPVGMEEAAVLGTWAYTAKGISGLDKGTFHVTVREDRLAVHFRDRWRGPVTGWITVHGSRVDIRLNHDRISGRLKDDRLTGSVRSDPWDVSTSRRRKRTGSFVARRIENPMGSDESRDFGCEPLLRESSYACSPLIKK